VKRIYFVLNKNLIITLFGGIFASIFGSFIYDKLKGFPIITVLFGISNVETKIKVWIIILFVIIVVIVIYLFILFYNKKYKKENLLSIAKADKNASICNASQNNFIGAADALVCAIDKFMQSGNMNLANDEIDCLISYINNAKLKQISKTVKYVWINKLSALSSYKKQELLEMINEIPIKDEERQYYE